MPEPTNCQKTTFKFWRVNFCRTWSKITMSCKNRFLGPLAQDAGYGVYQPFQACRCRNTACAVRSNRVSATLTLPPLLFSFGSDSLLPRWNMVLEDRPMNAELEYHEAEWEENKDTWVQPPSDGRASLGQKILRQVKCPLERE